MGDKFTLNDRNFHVKVTHHKKTDMWTAEWGSNMSVEGFSMANCLRLLADHLEMNGMHGTPKEILMRARMKPDILCKYCNAPIFFAVLTSGKYLAFDPEPIAGESVAEDDRVAMFPTVRQTDRGPKPLAVFRWGAVAQGPVYAPHPLTCGDTVTAPNTAALSERWRKNRTVSTDRIDQVIAGLKAIEADIEQGALDDPR